jgi:hypothetical protein
MRSNGSPLAESAAEARGNSRAIRLALFRVSGFSRRTATGPVAAAWATGPRGGTSLPPGRVRRDRAYPWPRRGQRGGEGAARKPRHGGCDRWIS